jgi:hypothetical protein
LPRTLDAIRRALEVAGVKFIETRKAMDQKQRRAIRAQTNDIQDRLNEHGPGRPGGPLGWPPARKGRPTGNSSAAIIRRLRRDHPELHQLVLAGELTPYRAAVIAGFRRQGRKPKRPVVVNLSAIAITPIQEMELWLGPSHHGSAFASDDERRSLWIENRDLLMRRWGQDGHRPQAWWRYDAPIPYPGPARERSALFEAGLLTKPEIKALTAEWRAEFERASQRDFFFVAAPDEIYQGAVARQKHFAWADIPLTLLQQWEAARQRAD